MKVEDDDFLNAVLEQSHLDIADNQRAKLAVGIKQYAASRVRSFAKTFIPGSYALAVLLLFTLANFGVWWIIYRAFDADIEFLRAGKQISRLITPEVIMALITGITIQTATAFLIVTKFFFQKASEVEKSS